MCSKCLSGYILAVDRKSCYLTNIDNRCSAFKEEAEPFCVLCNPGFILNDERKCVPINSDDSIKDCLLYNFTNTTHCEVCMPGFS